MPDLDDTIFAVATPPDSPRVIIRISGADAWSSCGRLAIGLPKSATRGIFHVSLQLYDALRLDAAIYGFVSPHSYTGEALLELHLVANRPLTEALCTRLIELAMRPAGPGEFTSRAYLNGKMDLMQAEAVNEIVSGTNAYQLAAAERMLGGTLGVRSKAIRDQLMDLLCLIEAGMDFSEEDIEFITAETLIARLRDLVQQTDALLERSARTEALLHLPSVGLAGVPNAGKSHLFNSLLKRRRSIVSGTLKTTRDVLAQPFSLPSRDCILFDCAGLLADPQTLIDELAQNAALESLRTCQLVLCCVDLSKARWEEDLWVARHLPSDRILPVGTKCDRVDPCTLAHRCDALTRRLGHPAIAVSSLMAQGLDSLITAMDRRLREQTSLPADGARHSDLTLLTSRHRLALETLRKSLTQALEAAQQDQMEIVAMMVREASLAIGTMEHPIEEEVLKRIFSRFCIGK